MATNRVFIGITFIEHRLFLKKQTMKHKKYNINLIKHEMRQPKWYDGLLRYAYAFHPLGCVLVMAIFIFIMAYTIFMWITSPSLTGNY